MSSGQWSRKKARRKRIKIQRRQTRRRVLIRDFQDQFTSAMIIRDAAFALEREAYLADLRRPLQDRIRRIH